MEVLIVEDNVFFRQIIKDILKSRFPTFAVSEAENGVKALHAFETRQPSVVFMDIKLSDGLDGLELTRRMREKNPGVTIIVVTNHDSPEYEAAALNSGADFFLSKNSSLGDEIAAILAKQDA